MKIVSTLLSAMLLLSLAAGAQEGKTAEKAAKKWFKKKEWLGGWDVKPHRSTDYSVFRQQYAANRAAWDKAFAYLKNTDLKALPKGKYPIDGENVFASVTENPSKDLDSTSWESHKKYIDLQYVIDGEELIGVYPAANATVTRAYDEKKDVMNYAADAKPYRADPSVFFLFFPSDAHRPNITPGGNRVVKKIVIKIRVA